METRSFRNLTTPHSYRGKVPAPPFPAWAWIHGTAADADPPGLTALASWLPAPSPMKLLIGIWLLISTCICSMSTRNDHRISLTSIDWSPVWSYTRAGRRADLQRVAAVTAVGFRMGHCTCVAISESRCRMVRNLFHCVRRLLLSIMWPCVLRNYTRLLLISFHVFVLFDLFLFCLFGFYVLFCLVLF